VRRPWQPDEALGALGTDTAGSIRIPAACCGVVGLKPTYGRVSRQGVGPLSWSLDHLGPITRTVEDAAIMLQAIAGYDASDPASVKTAMPDYSANLQDGVRGMRFAVPDTYFLSPAMQEVAAAVRADV
jgi:aspartyl-tRNA(Asn)/glutamyl-tRNA(Gln) amidotransferase subunit A